MILLIVRTGMAGKNVSDVVFARFLAEGVLPSRRSKKNGVDAFSEGLRNPAVKILCAPMKVAFDYGFFTDRSQFDMVFGQNFKV